MPNLLLRLCHFHSNGRGKPPISYVARGNADTGFLQVVGKSAAHVVLDTANLVIRAQEPDGEFHPVLGQAERYC